MFIKIFAMLFFNPLTSELTKQASTKSAISWTGQNTPNNHRLIMFSFNQINISDSTTIPCVSLGKLELPLSSGRLQFHNIIIIIINKEFLHIDNLSGDFIHAAGVIIIIIIIIIIIKMVMMMIMMMMMMIIIISMNAIVLTQMIQMNDL